METLVFFIFVGIVITIFGTWYLHKMKKEEHQ
jgi:hypothetical protein